MSENKKYKIFSFLFWLVLGIFILMLPQVSKLLYAYAWIELLLEKVENILKEK